ncbi:MAG: ribonuclease PH [bacterium]|nr:ribonuclease PH [bacterium]
MTESTLNRSQGRSTRELRPVTFERNYLDFAEGSCLTSFGRTRVLCTASVEDRVPPFISGSGQGWLTAEYAMLPKSTRERIHRERNKGGRAQEIQRLIGRSLRCVVDMKKLGEHTIFIDCDVIQADGGTRTAAISGAAVALHDALTFMKTHELIKEWPLIEMVAAVSVGLVDGQPCLDLDYREDSGADVDFNVVKTEGGKYVEVQGTAEHAAFDAGQLQSLLEIADIGIGEIIRSQRAVLGLEESC